MLSQEEIDALLGLDEVEEETSSDLLTDEEKDVLGEVANISMGTSATTLSSLVNHKVVITTPQVRVSDWNNLSKEYENPCVAIQVEYKEGLIGTNLLLMKDEDVKVITDLMMGGDGTNTEGELSELHLSAISEAMNQMIGSSATSMFSMLNKKIDIKPPKSTIIDFDVQDYPEHLSKEGLDFLSGEFVVIRFSMVVEGLIDSTIMQLYPIDFAKEMYNSIIGQDGEEEEVSETSVQIEKPQMQQHPTPQQSPNNNGMNQNMNQMNMGMPQMNMNNKGMNQGDIQRNVEAQPVQFQNFDMMSYGQQQENISLIMDVPLEVSVELGRTRKSIKEILEFAPGTVIELDKLSGEPVDVLVNGKFVAKGEVVVIDEYFGIRITDIINPNIRL